MEEYYKKSFKMLSLILAILLVLSLAACGNEEISSADESEIEGFIPEKDILEELGLNAEVKGASESTVKVNSAVYSLLDFEDTSEYENATRGLIAAPEVLELTDENGNVIWSQKAYSFLYDYEKAPDTVNPSLWENTRNNHAYGLFEVVEGDTELFELFITNLNANGSIGNATFNIIEP